jgi:hypothetical protein
MTEDHATHGRHEDDSATQNRQSDDIQGYHVECHECDFSRSYTEDDTDGDVYRAASSGMAGHRSGDGHEKISITPIGPLEQEITLDLPTRTALIRILEDVLVDDVIETPHKRAAVTRLLSRIETHETDVGEITDEVRHNTEFGGLTGQIKQEQLFEWYRNQYKGYDDPDVRDRIIREKLDNEPPTDLPQFPFAVGENITQRQTHPNLRSD